MKTLNKHITIILLLSLMLSFPAYGQYVTIVSDVKTEAQAAANAAMQMAIEKQNLNFIKETRERADSIAVMTTTWHALNTFYHNARSNVMGFTYETAMWKQIYAKFLQVAAKIPVAYNIVKSNPLSMIESIEYLGAAQERLAGLAKQYCDVVTNGRVVNPFKDETNFKYTKCPKCGGPIDIINTGNPRKPYVYACKNGNCGWDTGSDPEEPDNGQNGDGFNYLSFRDRYKLAESTYRQLLGLDWDLTRIIYSATKVSKSSSKNKFFYFLKGVDPTSYYNLLEAKRLSNASIQRIEDFKDYW